MDIPSASFGADLLREIFPLYGIAIILFALGMGFRRLVRAKTAILRFRVRE